MHTHIIINAADFCFCLTIVPFNLHYLISLPGIRTVLGDTRSAPFWFLVLVLYFTSDGSPLAFEEHASTRWQRLLPILDLAVMIRSLNHKCFPLDLLGNEGFLSLSWYGQFGELTSVEGILE